MIFEEPMIFHSQGVPLVGRFLRSSPRARPREPLVLCMGSWLTVKEQMALTYGRKLAELGYAAFVFDFSGFGESGGEPRQAELPARKIQDIFAAVEFVSTLSFVDPERIGCLAICASAQYTLAALARGAKIRSFASVAGWYHDPESIAPFYGGAEGVALRLGRAREALRRQLAGELVLAPAYAEGDDRAGMHFRLDYYARPERGAVPAWSNQMAEMTWLYWLLFDGLDAAARVTTPTLFVHSEGCAFPEHVRRCTPSCAVPSGCSGRRAARSTSMTSPIRSMRRSKRRKPGSTRHCEPDRRPPSRRPGPSPPREGRAGWVEVAMARRAARRGWGRRRTGELGPPG